MPSKVKTRRTAPSAGTTSRSSPPFARTRLCTAIRAWTAAESQNRVRVMSTTSVRYRFSVAAGRTAHNCSEVVTSISGRCHHGRAIDHLAEIPDLDHQVIPLPNRTHLSGEPGRPAGRRGRAQPGPPDRLALQPQFMVLLPDITVQKAQDTSVPATRQVCLELPTFAARSGPGLWPGLGVRPARSGRDTHGRYEAPLRLERPGLVNPNWPNRPPGRFLAVVATPEGLSHERCFRRSWLVGRRTVGPFQSATATGILGPSRRKH